VKWQVFFSYTMEVYKLLSERSIICMDWNITTCTS